ncbi:synaptotagmin-like protein 2 isoform X2 [Genypterus blacodes]|uniref:synaptotagmin-like protein 2 isoform X2 n=1 Tax=Genypterus blacodes TaxID=154954 RepID=UPI003F77826D
MIDLSHLTEEEQGVIMTVLRRDAELKRAEEERIRKLQTILNSSSQADANLKYLSGEWFYEAKSRRHMDKIHGSEIILASMKQRKGGSLDGSLRIEKPNKAPSGRGLDVTPPPKPARSLQATPQLVARSTEKQNLNSAIHSPGRQRHNPFNRASLILIEPLEKTDQDSNSNEKEVISPLKSLPATEADQMLGGSSTTEVSCRRPVPKKRTILPKRKASESNGFGLDPQPGSKAIPAPRGSLLNLDFHESSLIDQDEMPQRTMDTQSHLVSQYSQRPDETSQQPTGDLSQVSAHTSLDGYRNPPTIKGDRAATHTNRDTSPESGREEAGVHTVTLHTTRIRDSASQNNSSVGTATRQEELSVTHSIVGERSGADQNPVRRALRRAEARPKNMTKSMEDITSVTPRQERRQDSAAEPRRISNVVSIPSPSSSFSDTEHLKKMSKSVPSFLDKESDGQDTDSAGEDTSRRRRGMMGRSMTNLTNSSSLASESSLSGSVMTMYSGDYGNVEVQGNIQFSINYVQKLREFHIFVAKCQDLAAVDPKRMRSDPYIKSYLVPDKANLGKRKTSVKKKTLNPTFNEILRYRVRMEYLRTQKLILSVWHHDTFGRNSFLGEVDVDLSKWDFDHTQMNYLALKARTMPNLVPSNGRGEMKLAVRFLPQIIHSEGLAKEGSDTGEIHIWVKECRNLPLIRPTIDPYVKCFVLPDTSRKSRQKTRVLRRTVDPVFNHTMVYDGIREVDLTEACVELTVWDRDRLAANLLGGLRLGAGTGRSYGALVDWMDSTPYEVALWDRMMANPTEWVEGDIPLRMLNSTKTTFK